MASGAGRAGGAPAGAGAAGRARAGPAGPGPGSGAGAGAGGRGARGPPPGRLSAGAAAALDRELMGPELGFELAQLMELAGLSVACALQEAFPPRTHPRVLALCGPGNNGGDGLVAARHLHHFGYAVEVCYPKPTDKPLFRSLVVQCRTLGLPFIGAGEAERRLPAHGGAGGAVALDALFGFSFRGAPRPPFDGLLQALRPEAGPPPIVSVDVPSGWDVDRGDLSGAGIRPECLVSLSAPKLCSEGFAGEFHYLGGRFIPGSLARKYGLELPAYPGAAQCVRLE